MTYRDDILILRESGYTYNAISKTLGCSKGTVAYYCGIDQKDKQIARNVKSRSNSHYIYSKWSNFVHKRPKRDYTVSSPEIVESIRGFNDKVYHFYRKEGSMFTVQEAIDKIGDNPICYLTGDKIELDSPSTYHFDHVVPRSRGGDNSLSNLGLASSKANISKADLSLDEYIDLCKKVLTNFGYSVIKN